MHRPHEAPSQPQALQHGDARNVSLPKGSPLAPAQGSRQRRLWELNPAAHDLLLAGSFTALELRALVAHALGRVHRARCVLDGSDADVLYSAVHDLSSRNPLSQALHDALARRHGPSTARWRVLKNAAALQQAWRALLTASPAGTLVADLWGLLTHPAAAELQQAALYDYRHRMLSLSRDAAAADIRARQATAALAEQRSRCDTQQQRLLAMQQSLDALQRQLAAADVAARGAVQRADTAEARLALSERQQSLAAHAPDAAAARSPTDGPARCTTEQPQTPGPVDRLDRPVVLPAIAAAPLPRPRPSLAMAGRRLLCVGGMPGARQRYRALVEAAGARFDYHDGGIEDNVIRLDSQLAAADLVVCHSACLNHEAYHRIKGHCQRHGKPCVYLARPSLSFFARELGLGGDRPAP